MTVCQGAGRLSLHTADDVEGTELQGAAAGSGALSGVREGLGKWVTSCALPNPEHLGKMGDGVGGKRVRQGRRAQYIQDGISREGRTGALKILEM